VDKGLAAAAPIPEPFISVDGVPETMVQFGLLPTKDSSFKMATMTG
jgi:hypothetical protein